MRILLSMILILMFNIPALAAEPVKVVGVFDGDTLMVNRHGKNEYVSLQFINCYEAYTTAQAYKEAYLNGIPVETVVKKGQEAKNYVDNLLKPGDIISIERTEDCGQDCPGDSRVLTARVFLKNGKMLNKLLLDSKKCTY